MRKLILSLVTATFSMFAFSAADAMPLCRYPNGQIGPCGPITPVHQHRQRPGLIIAPQIQLGGAPMYSGVQSGGYRETSLIESDTTYRGPAQSDPRGEVPVNPGAIVEGQCKIPGAVYIREAGGCVGRVSDPAVMEAHRRPISEVCHGEHRPVQLPVANGGIATYMCP